MHTTEWPETLEGTDRLVDTDVERLVTRPGGVRPAIRTGATGDGHGQGCKCCHRAALNEVGSQTFLRFEDETMTDKAPKKHYPKPT